MEKEDYINEIKRMREKAKPAQKSGGGLQIAVTSLKGFYPVENASVKVFINEGEAQEVLAEDLTDKSGKTKVFSLSAPEISVSLDKNSTKLPYSLYNVSVYADGYIGQILMNIPVFTGVTSLQRVDLFTASSAEQKVEITDEMPNFNL